MSVNSTRNPEMVEALSPDFRRLYSPTHAMGDAIDMMCSLPACRAVYDGASNGGRVTSVAAGIGEAPLDGWMYARRSALWTSTGGFSGSVGINGISAPSQPLHIDGVVLSEDVSATGYTAVVVDAAAGATTDLLHRRGNLARWSLRANNTAESGSDVGTDLELRRFTDAGALVTPAVMFFERSTGYIGINNQLPSAPVHTLVAVGEMFRFENSVTDNNFFNGYYNNGTLAGFIQLLNSSDQFIVGAHSNSPTYELAFRTNSVERMRIEADGDVIVTDATQPLIILEDTGNATEWELKSQDDQFEINLVGSGGAEFLINGGVFRYTDGGIGMFQMSQFSDYTVFQLESDRSGIGQGLGDIRFVGLNSIASSTIYSNIVPLIGDNTNGSEDGRLSFYTILNGTGTEIVSISGGNVGIRRTTPTGKLDVNQSDASAGIPVLVLDQDDLSEEFINFVATIGAGNPIDTAAIGTYYGKVRVAVNGVFKYVALYNS